MEKEIKDDKNEKTGVLYIDHRSIAVAKLCVKHDNLKKNEDKKYTQWIEELIFKTKREQYPDDKILKD